MKALVVIAAAVLLAALGWWLGTGDQNLTHLASKPSLIADPPTKTETDANEVFRRAFWREPSPTDHIVHAERREWASTRDGVRRWQWFLAIEPSAELATWLRETNPFSLGKTTSVSFNNAPSWFPNPQALGSFEIQQSPNHGLTLLFEPKTNRLYATDGGSGFSTAEKSTSSKPALASGPSHAPRR